MSGYASKPANTYKWQHEPRTGETVFSVATEGATVGADEAKRAEGAPGNGGAAR